MESDSYPTIFLLLSVLAAFGRFAAYALDPEFGAKQPKANGENEAQSSTLSPNSGAKQAEESVGEDVQSSAFSPTSTEIQPVENVGNEAQSSTPAAKIGPKQPEENGGGKAQSTLRVCFTVRAIYIARHYLDDNFGEKLVSTTKFYRVTSISAFVVLGVFIFSHAISDTAWQLPSDSAFDAFGSISKRLSVITVCLLVLILWNAFFEMLSLGTVRCLIAPFDRLNLDDERLKRLKWRFVSLPVYLFIIYLCFLSTMNAAFSAIVSIRGVAAGYVPWLDFRGFWKVQLNILCNETLPRLIDPVGEGSAITVGNANLLVFCVLPLVPLVMISVISATGLLLDAVDRASGGQISRKLDSDDHDKHNKVFVATLIIALVGGLAGAGLGI